MNIVNCDKHGNQEETFVCQHIVESLTTKISVGFYYASEPRGDAWCNECEHMRIKEGGEWNEKSEAFASIKLLCGVCYDDAKRINTNSL